MILKKIIATIIVIFLLCSCGKEREEKVNGLSILSSPDTNLLSVKNDIEIITINESTQSIVVSDILEIERLIPLETTSESLLGTISKVVVDDNRLFVLDSRNTEKLAVFDFSGNHLFNIGSNGDGPDQYRGILDFTLDINKKEIYILDRQLNLVVYNINGKHKATKSIKTPINSISFIDEGLIALYSDSGTETMPIGNYKLKLYDIKKEQVVSTHLKTTPLISDRMVASQKNISSYDGGTSIYASSNDTIFQIKQNTLITKYVLDFKNNPRPKDFLEKLPLLPSGYKLLLESGYPTPPLGWEENTDFIYFRFARKNKIYHNFYSKESLLPIMSTSNITDDLFLGLNMEPVGNFKNQFIMQVDPGNLKMIRNYYKKNNELYKINYPEKFKKQLEAIEADQNPIILLANVKQ